MSAPATQMHADGLGKEVVLEESPIYLGATHFEPLAGVSVIMITGGAGFM